MVVKLERIGILCPGLRFSTLSLSVSLNVADAISGCIFLSLSLPLSLFPPSFFPSFFLYSSFSFGALPVESPAVPEETNGDRERHSKAPAFKDLKGGDRE